MKHDGSTREPLRNPREPALTAAPNHPRAYLGDPIIWDRFGWRFMSGKFLGIPSMKPGCFRSLSWPCGVFPQMPSGQGEKRASIFSWLTLNGQPSQTRKGKREPRTNWASLSGFFRLGQEKPARPPALASPLAAPSKSCARCALGRMPHGLVDRDRDPQKRIVAFLYTTNTWGLFYILLPGIGSLGRTCAALARTCAFTAHPRQQMARCLARLARGLRGFCCVSCSITAGAFGLHWRLTDENAAVGILQMCVRVCFSPLPWTTHKSLKGRCTRSLAGTFANQLVPCTRQASAAKRYHSFHEARQHQRMKPFKTVTLRIPWAALARSLRAHSF